MPSCMVGVLNLFVKVSLPDSHRSVFVFSSQAIDSALQVREMMYHKIKLNKIMAMLTGQTYEQVRPRQGTLNKGHPLSQSEIVCVICCGRVIKYGKKVPNKGWGCVCFVFLIFFISLHSSFLIWLCADRDGYG